MGSASGGQPTMPRRTQIALLLACASLCALVIAGCGGGGGGASPSPPGPAPPTPSPPAPTLPPSPPTPDPGTVAGLVDEETDVTRVRSATDTTNVASDSGFVVGLLDEDAPEVVIGETDAGRPLLLGFTDPAGSAAAQVTSQASDEGVTGFLGGEQLNATTTALALICMAPVFQGAEDGVREQVAEIAREDARFGGLVADVQDQIDAQRSVKAYPKDVYALAADIALSTAEAIASSSGSSTSQLPVRKPWVEDAPGADVRFVNPTCTYYWLEIRDSGGRVVGGPICIEARPGIIEFQLFPPRISVEDKTTEWPLGNAGAGTYYCAMYKGLATLFPTQLILEDFTHPASLAAVLNTYKGMTMVLSLALPKLPDLPLHASTLERFLIPVGDVFAIGQAIRQGDALRVVYTILQVAAENADTIALWVFEETGKSISSEFIDTVALVAKKLAWVLMLAEIANEIVPYIYDMVMSPWSIGFELEQSANGSVRIVREAVGLDRPRIDAITPDPADVSPGGQAELTCQASDDEDPPGSLAYSWSIAGDHLTGNPVRWTAPASPSTHSGQCFVRDPWGLDGVAPRSFTVTVTETVIIIE